MTWPWPSSETTGKVIPAFVLALQAVEDVTRSKSVNAGNMRYSYADLDAVLAAVKPVLVGNGLAVTQAAAQDGVTSLLMHESGEWLSFPPLHVSTQQNTPQGQGSALTYARRYQMLALLNIATEDDDGKSAAKPRKASQVQPERMETGSAAPAHEPSEQQRKRAQILAKELWGDDRTQRLSNWSEWVGRIITSFNDLTEPEAASVISTMANKQKVAAG